MGSHLGVKASLTLILPLVDHQLSFICLLNHLPSLLAVPS